MKRITLASVEALASSKVRVDRETGMINDVAIISKGTAKGHGFQVDDKMLRQVRDSLNAGNGLKVHLTHSHAEGGLFSNPSDGITSVVAKVEPKSAYIENGVVRGNVKLLQAAANSPQGDMRTYLLDLASEAPEMLGLSIVFTPDKFEEKKGVAGQMGEPAGRIKELHSVDFVGDPGANAKGLLSAKTDDSSQGEDEMNAELLKALGLSSDASQEQVTEAVKALQAKVNKTDAEKETEKQALAAIEADKATKLAAENAVKLERERVGKITKLAEQFPQLPKNWASEMINGGFTIHEAQDNALEKLSKDRDVLKTGNAGSIAVGEDNRSKMLSSALPDAIRLRAGLKIEKPHDEARKLSGMPLLQMARVCLAQYIGRDEAEMLGTSEILRLLSRRELLNRYPTVNLSQSSSDFTNIMADTINKTLKQAYLDAPKQWSLFARMTTNADFKTITRAALSESADLAVITEGQNVQYATLTDAKETYSLAEYIGGIALTRRAIINDDLDSFARIPVLQANAAARKEDDVAFAAFTGNPNMGDSVALFHSSHANLVSSGSVGAPSTATIAATETLMLKQKGPKSAARMNLMPKFIIVPVALKAVTEQFINSVVDSSKNNATTNVYNGKLQVVANARLDDVSATQWYLMSDYRDGQIDTVEVCFLADEQTPQLATEEDFDSGDMKFKVRHTVAAKAIDWRGIARNNGA